MWHFFYFSGPSTAPKSLRAQSITDSSVTLSWMELDSLNGIITAYELQYKNCVDQNFSMLQPMTNQSTRTVTDLVGNTEVCFKVRAYTVVGSGPWTVVERTCKSHAKMDTKVYACC